MGVNVQLELDDRYDRRLILSKTDDELPVLAIVTPVGRGRGGVADFELDEIAKGKLMMWLGVL